MADLYALTPGDVNRLRELLRWFERTPKGNTHQQITRPSLGPRSIVELGQADSTIAGTTTGTPGSGTVSVYGFTSTGGTTDTGINVTAYNFSKDSVASGRWLHLVRHHRSGRWLVNYEDCGTTS